MYINILRLISLILLFTIVLIKDIPFKKIYKDPLMQMYFAIICITILMLIDNITGFILTIGLLLIYFRIYSNDIKNKTENNNIPKTAKVNNIANFTNSEESCRHNEGKCGDNLENCGNNGETCTLDLSSKKTVQGKKPADIDSVPYITEENLLAAQTNIYNADNYDKEIGEESSDIKTGSLYKSQGLNNNKNHLRGFDNCNTVLGGMKYNIFE
jgi:hypothetical protein